MNKIYHGIDLVDISRIENLLQRHPQRFLQRVFTHAELKYCSQHRFQGERLAGRFAVKEAVMKMLGTGWSGGVAWTDIETINDPSGRPEVHLSGKVARIARKMGIEQTVVSITHTRDLAVASAVGLGSE